MSKILFVDDDYLTLEMYEKIFSLQGHQIFLAESGNKAIQIAEETSLDLIVLDMRLEEMDGFALLEQLKLNPSFRDIPAVMVSANPDLYAERAIKAGAQYYMSKPINPEKIQHIIESMGEK